MTLSRPFARNLIALFLAFASLTCGGDKITLPNEREPAKVVAFGGDGQSGTVAMTLAQPLVVSVTDSKDRPVQDARVAFVLSGNGANAGVAPDTATTDVNGRGQTTWLLGTAAGRPDGAGPGGRLPPADGHLHCLRRAGRGRHHFLVRGNNQSANVSSALTDSLVVKVTDRFGNAVGGTLVSWAPARAAVR